MADVSDGSTKISVSINELFGTGIQSVEQTQTSEESGGTNEITVTLTNGVTSQFYVRNGMSGGTPVPVETADLMTETSNAYLYLGSEEGYDYGYVYVYMNDVWTKTDQYGVGEDGFSPAATVTPNETGALISVTDKNGTTTAQIDNGKASDQQVADWLDNHPEATTTVADGSISVEKLASDTIALIGNSTLTENFKQALLNIFQHVTFVDEHGQDYYDDLEDALYPPANLTSISAVFNQGVNVIYDTDDLDDLKQYLTVTAHYDDSTTETITEYTLTGTLTAGTSIITVTYGGKTTTFNVTVTHMTVPLAITNNLTNCTTSNSAQTVTEGGAYSATITADSGYTLTGAEVSITMGGTDITASAYDNGTISIASVTGAVVITISAADSRTLLYHWDFTGANPLVDKVSSKTATEAGTVTYDSGGMTFGTYASCIVLADLSTSILEGKDVEITLGDMITTGTSSTHQRLFTFSNNYGLICRNTTHTWSIYGNASGSNAWQDLTVNQNDVANKTFKLSINSLTDIDVYLDNDLILEDVQCNNSTSSGQVRLGATSNSNVIVKIKSFKVYERGE